MINEVHDLTTTKNFDLINPTQERLLSKRWPDCAVKRLLCDDFVPMCARVMYPNTGLREVVTDQATNCGTSAMAAAKLRRWCSNEQ